MIDESSPYTAEQIEEFRLWLGLKSSHAIVLHNGLHNAALSWRLITSFPSSSTTVTDVSSELKRLASAAGPLAATLAETGVATWHAMRDLSDIHNSDLYKSGIVGIADQSETTEAFQPAIYLQDIYGQTTVSIDDLRRCLAALAAMAGSTRHTLPPATRGPQVDRPLLQWIYKVRQIFNHELKIPFTRDECAGVPISPAARVCVAAFSVLSPETPASRVLRAMKYEIAEHRKSITGGVREFP